MNYAKWDHIVDSDDEECKSPAAGMGAGNVVAAQGALEPLQIQKQVADDMFDRAEAAEARGEKSGDYSSALDRYEDLIPTAAAAAKSAPANSELFIMTRRLEFSCNLNAATCYLRLQQWTLVVDRVTAALGVIQDESLRARLQISVDKVLRARQLKVLASLEIGGTECIRQAQREAELMRQAIRRAQAGQSGQSMSAADDQIGPERLREYQQVFDAVLRRCTAVGVDIVSQAAAMAREPGDGALEEGRREVQRGWEMVRAKRFRDALDALDGALAHLPAPLGSSSNSGDADDRAALLMQLWQGKATALDSLGDAEQSAEAYANVASYCPAHEAGSYLLKAAAAFYKLRLIERALQTYRASHAACKASSPSPSSSSSSSSYSPSPPSSSSSTLLLLDAPSAQGPAPLDLVGALAQAGAGTCLLRLQHHEECIPVLSEAACDLGLHLNELLAGAPGTPTGSSSLPEIQLSGLVSTIQHLWNALDGLSDAHAHLEQFEAAAEAADRALVACDAVLALGGYDVKRRASAFGSSSGSSSNSSGSNSGADSTSSNLAILRKRRACTLLSKGHLACARSNARLDPAHMTTASSYWTLAAEELSQLGDHRQAMMAYKNVASMWTEAAGVEPFGFEATVEVDAGEAGHDAWRLVAQQALRLADAVKKDLPLDFQGKVLPALSQRGGGGYKPSTQRPQAQQTQPEEDDDKLFAEYHASLEEAMRALYSAGVCAVHLDDKVAIRALEAAQQVQRDYSQLHVSLPEAQNLSYQLACGDLAYYSAHCNLKLGSFAPALTQLQQAWDYYSLCEDRKRKKLVLGLQSLAYTAAGDKARVEEAIAQLRGLCLQPLEVPDKEVAALREIVYPPLPRGCGSGDYGLHPPALTARAQVSSADLQGVCQGRAGHGHHCEFAGHVFCRALGCGPEKLLPWHTSQPLALAQA